MYTELCIQHPVNTFTLEKKKKQEKDSVCGMRKYIRYSLCKHDI